jgi:hypothetical protein
MNKQEILDHAIAFKKLQDAATAAQVICLNEQRPIEDLAFFREMHFLFTEMVFSLQKQALGVENQPTGGICMLILDTLQQREQGSVDES